MSIEYLLFKTMYASKPYEISIKIYTTLKLLIKAPNL